MSAPEERIERALVREDWQAAATLAVETWGGELFGYLVGRLGNEQQAQDVFSLFLEDFWRGLPGYARRASFRAWMYALVRNACHRYLDRELRPRRREAALSEAPEVLRAAEKVRTQTELHRRTTGRERADLLRSQLSEEEQTLLTLRVDRGLEWREIAQVLGAESGRLDAEAARLRKRFQLIKERLRRLARDAGWLNDGA